MSTMSVNVPFPPHTRRPCRWQRKHGRASQRSTMQKKYADISISLDVCSEIALDPIPVPHVEDIYPICCASNKEHVPLHRVLQPAAHEF